MSGDRRRPKLGNTLTKRRAEPRRRGRLARTILLGTAAVAFSLFWVARDLELDTRELLGFLGASAVFVGLMAVLGVLGAAAIFVFKRLGR